MRKISLAALLLLCLTLLLSCHRSSGRSYLTFGEDGVLCAQVETEESGTVKVPSPAGMHTQYCIGWYSKDGGETVFLPVGATYEYAAGTNKNFTPLYLHFTTASTPTLDTTVEGGGIAFATEITRTDWVKLTAVTANVSRGTLISTATDLTAVGGTLTHAALTTAEKSFFDISADAWQAESEQLLTFGATLANIDTQSIATRYTAVGYVRITYSNGTDAYVYANYGAGGAPSTSLLGFTEAAKQHLSFTTDPTAALDLTAVGGGIEYVSTIKKDDWNLLAVTAETISCGTLFYPAEGLAELGGELTHAALERAGKAAADIVASTWLTNTGEALSFGATLTGIPVYHRTIAYAAAGYIKITYSDGSAIYIYANRDAEQPAAHSILSLVNAAQNDLSEVETDTYRYAVGDLFSPYTDAERAALTELSVPTVSVLVNQSSTPGKYILDPVHLAAFSSRLVRDNDASCAEEWERLYQVLGDIDYDDGGALVITANDGTALSSDNIFKVTMSNGKIKIDWTKYTFYNGALIVPYSVYTGNY